MPKGRRLGAEQIVTKLRQIEVLQGQGKSLAAACKDAGTTEQTQGRMSRWRDLLQPERGTDRHRELARPLQHQATALRARLSTTGTADGHATARPDAHHELTSQSAWYKISVRPLQRTRP